MANGFGQCSTVAVLSGTNANGSVLYGVGSLRKPLPLSIFGEEEEEELVEEQADSSSAKQDDEEFGVFESAPVQVENGGTSISGDELGFFGDFLATEASKNLEASVAVSGSTASEVFGHFSAVSASSSDDLFGDFSTPATNDGFTDSLQAQNPSSTFLQPGDSFQPQNSSTEWISAASTSTLMLAMHGIHGSRKDFTAAPSDTNSPIPAPTSVMNTKVVAAATNVVGTKAVDAEDPDDWGDFVEPEVVTSTAPTLLALPAPPSTSKGRVGRANGSPFQMLDLISLDAGPASPIVLDMHSSSPAEPASKGGDMLLLSWDDDPRPPEAAVEVEGGTGKKTDVEDLLVAWDDEKMEETAAAAAAAAAVEGNGQTVRKTDIEDMLLAWDEGTPADPAAFVEVEGQAGKKMDVKDLLGAWEDGEAVESGAGKEGVAAAPVPSVEAKTGKKMDVEDLFGAWDDGGPMGPVVGVEGPALDVEPTGKNTGMKDLYEALENGVPAEPGAGLNDAAVPAVEVESRTMNKTDVEDLFGTWEDGEPVQSTEGITEEEAVKNHTSTTTDLEELKESAASYRRSTSLPGADFTDFISSLYPEPDQKATTTIRSQSNGKLTTQWPSSNFLQDQIKDQSSFNLGATVEDKTTDSLLGDLFEGQTKNQTSSDQGAMVEDKGTASIRRHLFKYQIKNQASNDLGALLEDKIPKLLSSDLFEDEGGVNNRKSDELASPVLNHESSMTDLLNLEAPVSSYVDMLTELKVHTTADDPLLAQRKQIQSLYVTSWSSLASACAAELNHAVGIWRDATRARCRNQVLATEQGRRYYLAVGEVYKVAEIIKASAKVYIGWLDAAPETKLSIQTALVQCEGAWASLDGAVEPAVMEAINRLQETLVSLAEYSLPISSPETSQDHCCLSLLPLHHIPALAVAAWRGRRCLLRVANFWANRVSRDPPCPPSCE